MAITISPVPWFLPPPRTLTLLPTRGGVRCPPLGYRPAWVTCFCWISWDGNNVVRHLRVGYKRWMSFHLAFSLLGCLPVDPVTMSRERLQSDGDAHMKRTQGTQLTASSPTPPLPPVLEERSFQVGPAFSLKPSSWGPRHSASRTSCPHSVLSHSWHTEFLGIRGCLTPLSFRVMY